LAKHEIVEKTLTFICFSGRVRGRQQRCFGGLVGRSEPSQMASGSFRGVSGCSQDALGVPWGGLGGARGILWASLGGSRGVPRCSKGCSEGPLPGSRGPFGHPWRSMKSLKKCWFLAVFQLWAALGRVRGRQQGCFGGLVGCSGRLWRSLGGPVSLQRTVWGVLGATEGTFEAPQRVPAAPSGREATKTRMGGP